MKGKRMVWLAAAGVLLAGIWFLVGSAVGPAPAAGGRHSLEMVRPPFASVAYAEESSEQLDIGAKLDAEAGISAWYSAGMPIDLNVIRPEFVTIELETTEYIIGSVAVPNYVEHFDMHVYVHVDGWMLAYYLNGDLTAKIVDVKGWTISSTNMTTVLATIAGVAGVPFTGETYYDFRYPNATNLLFVAEDDTDGSDFTINMPTSYAYPDRGWAKYCGSGGCAFTIDGEQAPVVWGGDATCYGDITAAMLDPGVTHVIDVNSYSVDYGVLVVTYRVP
jgi:hypothetical protein